VIRTSIQPRKTTRRHPPRFDLIAGNAALDFVNTLDDRHTSQPKELLKSYIDLARFAEDTGLVEPSLADRLMERSLQFPQQAQESLDWARKLREEIHDVFWAVIRGKPAPPAALVQLNANAQTAAGHLGLHQVNGRFEWRFDEYGGFDTVVWPLALAAVELLASDDLQFVRACASKDCEWFFLDTSKNHHRRWCDMKRCGNRAKVRRFYARQKSE